MEWEILFGQLISGLMKASILFLITSGLTLIFGVLGVLNLAHVSLYMLGAYFTCTFWELLEGTGISYWLAVPLACATVAGIGLLIEVVLMRRLRSRIQPEVMLATFALIYIFSDIAKLTWGVQMYSIPKPEALSKPVVTLGAVTFPASIAFTIAVALFVGVGLWFWLQRTRSGRIVRATQSDREMVSALGINVPFVYAAVFVASAALAGLAGAVWVATGIVQPGRLDIPMLPQVFCVMIIGGLGSFKGTAVAAIMVGLAFSFSILIAPKAGMFVLFVVTAIVLVVRPWGLFGQKGRLE